MLLVKANKENKPQEEKQCGYYIENKKLREEIAILKKQLSIRFVG